MGREKVQSGIVYISVLGVVLAGLYVGLDLSTADKWLEWNMWGILVILWFFLIGLEIDTQWTRYKRRKDEP